MTGSTHDPFWGLDPEQQRTAQEKHELLFALGRAYFDLLRHRSLADRLPELEKELAEVEKKVLSGEHNV